MFRFISADATCWVTTPIAADVDILATKGFVSNWYILSLPEALRLSYNIFESLVVAILIAVSVLEPG